MPYENKRDFIQQQCEQYRDSVQTKIDRQIRKWEREGKDLNSLTRNEAIEIDESYHMKEYAKQQILDSESNSEILMKAEMLLEEDWLGKVDALPGNLFCLGAFGDILPEHAPCFSLQNVKGYTKYFGCILIVLLQLLGPPLIFLSKMPGNIGVQNARAFAWRCHPFIAATDPTDPCPGGMTPDQVGLFEDWKHLSTTRFVGTLFIIVFILNGLFVIFEEKKAWANIYNTFRYLDIKTPKFRLTGMNYLALGCVVNCWVVFWVCLDMYVVVGSSETPQDLLMDALGLIFLYNLDDIGGDMAFIDDHDWPALRIAWIYDEMVHRCDIAEFDENDHKQMTCRGWLCMQLYKLETYTLMVMLWVIPAMAIVTPFTQIAPGD